MNFNHWCLLLAALVFATAAWFGIGFQSEDEFHQVVIVAEQLRGRAGASDMLMDFHAHWRSMVLPVIAAGLFEACAAVGITDPFTLTFILRALTAALALLVLRDLARVVKPMVRPENRITLDILTWFLWFMPVLLMRFTGETWSALLFARGLALLLDERRRSPWAIGAWWGAAVLLRPAAALLPMGAWAWAVTVKKVGRAHALRMLAGGIIAIVAGTAIDSMAYGTATMPLANYLIAAFSGQENARFTALPWYQYGLFALKHATIPVGLLLAAALTVLLVLKRSHVLVWVVLPFLVAHAVVPIKEPRFLYPLAPLMPWLLVAAWDALCERWPATMQGKLVLRLLFPFAVVNAVALVVGIATPAGNGRIRLAQEIAKRYGQEPVHIDHVGDWRQWIPAFYLSARSTEQFVDRIIPSKDQRNHLVIAHESKGLDRVQSLQRLAVGAPPWAHRPLRWYGLEDGYDPLVLYRLTTENIGH